MTLNDASLWAILAGTIVGLPSILAGWIKWVLPRYQRWQGKRDAEHEALAGRPAVVDKATGKVLAPARPGIGEWMGSINDQMSALTEAVKSRAHVHERIDRLTDRVKALEEARAERIVAQAESAHMWRALADEKHGQVDEADEK